MSKHTAGPWSIHPKAHLVVIGAAGHLVASCSGYTNNQVCQESLEAEQKANMHLVAAAPNLLEALEWMVSLFPGGVEDDGYGIGFNENVKEKYRAAVKAIAKAKGLEK